MYGIPLKYLALIGGLLIGIVIVFSHFQNDKKMREQIISLQVDLRTSKSNYSICETTNAENAEKSADQQASIDRFAAEKQAAIEQANISAAELTQVRKEYETESWKLRKRVQDSIVGSDCATAAIPADALKLLNDTIRRASGN